MIVGAFFVLVSLELTPMQRFVLDRRRGPLHAIPGPLIGLVGCRDRPQEDERRYVRERERLDIPSEYIYDTRDVVGCSGLSFIPFPFSTYLYCFFL
jgi:hypothetical protein